MGGAAKTVISAVGAYSRVRKKFKGCFKLYNAEKSLYEKEMTLTGSKRPINYSVISLAEIRAEK